MKKYEKYNYEMTNKISKTHNFLKMAHTIQKESLEKKYDKFFNNEKMLKRQTDIFQERIYLENESLNLFVEWSGGNLEW